MPGEWTELGKEFLKLAVRPRFSFCFWVVSALILLAPLPSFLNLDPIKQEFGKYIGLVCLFMFMVWAVEIILMGCDTIKANLLLWREEGKILEHLDSLNSREAHLLAVAVSNKIQTVTWRQDGDEAASLMAKGLLSQVPDNSMMFHKPYTIPRFVWKQINKPEMLTKLKELDREITS